MLGDVAIHEKAGQDFWTGVAAALEERFRKGEFTEGVLDADRARGRDAREGTFPGRTATATSAPDE